MTSRAPGKVTYEQWRSRSLVSRFLELLFHPGSQPDVAWRGID